MKTIKVKITVAMLAAEYMSNTHCPMALGLKQLGFCNVSCGGSYARIMNPEYNTVAVYNFPDTWTTGFIQRALKRGKDINVVIRQGSNRLLRF